MDREYAYCPNCGEYIYRIPGHRHGDGQIDTDGSPVWLLTIAEALAEDGIDPDTLPEIPCGCTD